MEQAIIESSILFGFLTVFSCGLWIISIRSYKKSHNKKILFVSGVFSIFFIRGILLSLGLFYPEIEMLHSITLYAFFDLIMLVLLFIAVLRQ
ncbi:MAG: hypothetical protein KKC68_07630 [Candidatus Thermoplasmatota archaeon]|nr:hypothetical protein [Candidatus Thermoplasmatota archaeon]MBU1941629.1 hypothetical protein [Candidatus Thermoplasmatota archaeon]